MLSLWKKPLTTNKFYKVSFHIFSVQYVMLLNYNVNTVRSFFAAKDLNNTSGVRISNPHRFYYCFHWLLWCKVAFPNFLLLSCNFLWKQKPVKLNRISLTCYFIKYKLKMEWYLTSVRDKSYPIQIIIIHTKQVSKVESENKDCLIRSRKFLYLFAYINFFV